MTATAAAKRMDAEEFLSWVVTQEKGRYELYGGEIFAMAPERAGHAAAKFNAARALADAVARAGVPCQAFVDGLGVRIDDRTVYEPDALVNCGEPVPPESLLAPAPMIVVEVLSPTTHGVDTSIKLTDYFRLSSVMHYLIVDLQHRLALHYRRDGALIVLAVVDKGDLVLDPPGLSIKLDDIFA